MESSLKWHKQPPKKKYKYVYISKGLLESQLHNKFSYKLSKLRVQFSEQHRWVWEGGVSVEVSLVMLGSI